MRALPPYARLLQVRTENGPDGAPLLTMPFHEDVIGRPGYLHGGALAGLVAIAAFTTRMQASGDESVQMKPITVTVDYMRPGLDSDTKASAVVSRLGATMANVEAFAWQEKRELPIASARLNFLLERPKAA